ncbi:MAG: hypothetical protein IT371_26780 [Deltaproteobacteria bacterium]|nr:hypothetical protein [Deltaproteobacteria bacterium]
MGFAGCRAADAPSAGHRWTTTPAGAFDLPQCGVGQTLTGQVDASFGLNLRGTTRQPASWEASNLVWSEPVLYGQIVLVDEVRVGDTYGTGAPASPWSNQWARVRAYLGGVWRHGYLAAYWIAPLGCLSPVPTAGPTEPPPPTTPGPAQPPVSAWETIPGAETFNSNPSGFADAGGQTYLFFRGADGAIYERRRTDREGWMSWSLKVEGSARSAPAAVVDAQGRQSLFVRGTDDRVYLRQRVDGTWTGWQTVDPYMATNEPPAAAVDGQGQLFLFLRSTANQLLENLWQGTSWRGWTLVPSLPTDRALAAARRPDGRLELYARGTDGRIYRALRKDTLVFGQGYEGWQALPDATEPLLSAAAVAPGGDGQLRVYAVGSRRTFFELAPGARSWTALPSPGVETPEGPAVLFDGRALRVFVRDAQGRCLNLGR